MPKIIKFLISIVLCEGAGIIGSFFTTPAIGSWYATLTKPSFNPPNWVFAPVWTLLFFLMGVGLYLIWVSPNASPSSKDSKGQFGQRRITVLFFIQQLSLNILWSAIFFGLHNPMLAFTEIIVLWFGILITIFYFAKISKTASWLLVPYILWVSFAGFLNFSIWRLMM
ncbi:MAG: tryptophan-rich sensory protein [Candidatus Pacebacteria bacterium]|nr:tryptophan-rich sensory protein [Candidatus Paceibacterota bacterium]